MAPAFDVIHSFNPEGTWTSSHQMTMNGKRDRFTLDDFKACAASVSMKRGRAEVIIEEVRRAVSRWRDFADETRIMADRRDTIQNTLRLEII